MEILKTDIKSLNNKRNQINYGIQLLRMILSYLIVQIHCYDFNQTKNKLLLFTRRAFDFYVPTFYIISYYFSYNILKMRNIYKIKQRLLRIIIPYLIWPTIFYIIQYIYYLLNKEPKYCVKDLYIQFLTGKRIINAFWFLCHLIFSFILFAIILLLTNKNRLFLIQFIGLIGNLYYFTHYYNHLFSSCIYEVRSLIQDFSKVLFYSSIGISFTSISINYLKNNRKKFIFFALINLLLLKNYNEIWGQFFYLKLFLVGFGSSSIFLIFLLLPFDSIKSEKIKLIFQKCTNYTGGIYYLHSKISKYFLIKVFKKTVFGCVINYIICYLICDLGIKYLGKTLLKHLFI